MRMLKVNAFADLTGFHADTIRKRLDGKLDPVVVDGSPSYNSQQALPLIYCVNEDETELRKQILYEELELTRAKKEKMQLEVLEMKSKLVDYDEMAQILGRVLGAVKAKLLIVPRKASMELKYAKTQAEHEAILNRFITEALKDVTQNPMERFESHQSKETDVEDAGTARTPS